MSKPLIEPICLSRVQAAKALGVSPGHFDKYVAVKPIVLGRRKLWSVTALRRFVDRESGSNSDVVSIDDWIAKLAPGFTQADLPRTPEEPTG